MKCASTWASKPAFDSADGEEWSAGEWWRGGPVAKEISVAGCCTPIMWTKSTLGYRKNNVQQRFTFKNKNKNSLQNRFFQRPGVHSVTRTCSGRWSWDRRGSLWLFWSRSFFVQSGRWRRKSYSPGSTALPPPLGSSSAAVSDVKSVWVNGNMSGSNEWQAFQNKDRSFLYFRDFSSTSRDQYMAMLDQFSFAQIGQKSVSGVLSDCNTMT